MATLRLVHTADLRLGHPFAGFAGRDRLRAARQGVIARLLDVARRRSAAHILVAGGLFDAADAAPDIRRQALAEIAEAGDVTWWILPGGRDAPDAPDASLPPNMRVLRRPAPIEIAAGVWLSPVPARPGRAAGEPSRDAAATPPGAIRIGVAHLPAPEARGGGFAGGGEMTARLDWLALGGRLDAARLSPRAAFAGSPERIAFGAPGRGTCFVVEIDGPGAVPRVETVETGLFDWRRIDLVLAPDDDAGRSLAAALPGGVRRNMVVSVVATGRLPLAAAQVLAAEEAETGPDFCHFEVRMCDLAVDLDPAAHLVPSAPRAAAGPDAGQHAGTGDEAAPSQAQRVAETALRRLHALILARDGSGDDDYPPV